MTEKQPTQTAAITTKNTTADGLKQFQKPASNSGFCSSPPLLAKPENRSSITEKEKTRSSCAAKPEVANI